ncbi:TPA: transcription-repair coupling factor, partial [Burkholderia multivorans]|nr:transcription-repair coupling factor [Burkholderia multivorans]HDR9415784.1 transcription-repair coupling factor [Burkholderia multivorans]HDR9438230.1 transcription-repair coupling factor [Burkholderia multivorans]HDR9461267.1 transcription-repair coupling factor [Burkholderia multivorans]HDR9467198.1 transcription-repair coupling factor [Burkholderia multivorans]
MKSRSGFYNRSFVSAAALPCARVRHPAVPMPDNASTPFASPVARVKPGQRFAFDGTHGSADALAIARYLADNREHVPLLAVICANAVDAQRLSQEIGYFSPDARVRLLPDWETLPYDTFSPHQDLVSERLATLHDLGEGRCDILLVPATTALYRMPPASFMAAYTFAFAQGERLDEAKLKSQLTLAGYEHVSQVVRPGEYCVRGSLIDLFPMGSPLPYRIDLFDDQVDSIRAFDPDTQRSLYPVRDVRLLPGREFPFDEAARTAFRSRWRETFEGDPSRAPIYKDIGNGVPSAGIEYYLPLFFDETATLFHYLPQNAHLVFAGDLDAAIRRFTADTRQRYAFLSHDRERPILEPQRLFLSDGDFFTLAKPFARLVLPAQPAGGWATALPELTVDRHADDPLAALRTFVETSGKRVLLTVESAGRRETILQLLAEHRLRPASNDHFAGWLESDARFALGVAPLANGFAVPGEGYAIVTETELYGALGRRAGRRRQEQASNVDAMVRDLSELKVGDPVVHAQHGIGRYMGLVSMDLGEGETEFLHLEYAGESKLYVPVAQLHVISRYSGADPDSAPLHALGSGQWERAKRKAAQQIRDTAAELLNL